VQISAREVQGADSRERLEVIESEIRRMQQVLQDYLSFSRPLEKIHPEEVQLGAIVADVVALLGGRAAEAQVTVRARGDARVFADPMRIKEAVLNLVANAIEASSPGRRVDVTVAHEGGIARVVVADSGTGMPPEVLAQIGTPFLKKYALG
jgi:two-component system, NtrC family, sensor histidine kinase HydH